MTSSAVLRSVVAALTESGIAHMLTGSFAAAYHGAPRATMDIDLVIEATEDQLRSLVGRLTARHYYVSETAAIEARRHASQFNVIELDTGWKVDLIIRKDRPFSHAEFGRRVAVNFEGVELAVASLEDIILAKLEWARLAGSARQLEDVVALLRVREEDVDRAYLERWVDDLNVRAEWDETRKHK